MTNENEGMAAMRAAVEKRLGFGVNTPGEFKLLAGDIKAVTGRKMSESTLMRLWGYVRSDMTPNTTTLDTLALYVGYHDWDSFARGGGEGKGDGSHDVLSAHLNVDAELSPRDHVILRWPPGRECLVRYLGDGQFVVERSEQSKLKVGDTFTCHLIVEGHPLYLDNLVHEAQAPRCYVCGHHNGVHYEVIKAKSENS